MRTYETIMYMRFGCVFSCIKLAGRVFGLDHINPVHKDTLYSDSMKQRNIKIIFFLTFSLFLSLSILFHILAARNSGVSWPPTPKKKERKCQGFQRPPYARPPFCVPSLGYPRGVPPSSFIFQRLHQEYFQIPKDGFQFRWRRGSNCRKKIYRQDLQDC